MNSQPKIAWAIEYVEGGHTRLHMHQSRHASPEEAKNAFAEHMGIPWKELERRGAKVIQHQLDGHPPKSSEGPGE